MPIILTNKPPFFKTINKPEFATFYNLLGLISQNSTFVPTIHKLLDNMPCNYTLTRDDVGIYLITFDDPILLNSTWVQIRYKSQGGKTATITWLDEVTIEIRSWDALGALADSCLADTPFEVRLYY